MLDLSFTDLIALIAIIWWPLIPLFWIPVHGLPRFFKRLGFYTYLLPVITWLPLAIILYSSKNILLEYRIALPLAFNIAGWLLLCSGTFLHIWTGYLLNFWGLIGVPEIFDKFKSKMVTSGPFSFVRHPTYLAHTMMFGGVFLLSGVVGAGLVAILDFLIAFFIIIPLEERELLNRFHEEYREYRRKVPRFFPAISLLFKQKKI